MRLQYDVEDLVMLKKGHACGSNEWKILRTGADIKLQCMKCDRQIWMSRMDFEKRVRKIKVNDKFISIVNYNPMKVESEEV